MNLLHEGIEQGAVIKTTMSRKLTIDGITQSYPVYKVRLDVLFYNDQNDRIATWISHYKSMHEGQAPGIENITEYNDIIEQFIVESNPEAIKKTQSNIELFDQREPGVVLVDGRIIDGNRRFTCLRRLKEKNTRFEYFETAILDRDIENSAKQIKMLELSIQHGEEGRVEYNPIDRLVGVYNDIIETGLLSVEEYARSTNEPVSDVKHRVELASLMVEFLDYINAPKQFYIARDLQVAFPLDELLKLLRKCEPEQTAEHLKKAVFTNILMHAAGDMTRYIRNIKGILGTDYQDEFLTEQETLAAQVAGKLPVDGSMSTAAIKEIVRENDEVAQELSRSTEKALTKAKKEETRNRPIQLTEKAITFLESIDTNILEKMNDSELQRLARQINKLEQVLGEIKGHL